MGVLPFIALLASFTGLGTALQGNYVPERPPNVPLAVRSPYLSTGLPMGSDDNGHPATLNGEWPTFWQRAVTGWEGIVQVDGKNYEWMGFADANINITLATQKQVNYTSTRSIFTMEAGPVTLDIEFLSPVTPTDFKRMSFPASYMNVNVQSNDGQSHKVQLYTDVTAEWATADRNNAIIEWDYSTTSKDNSTGGLAYHQFARQTQLEFSEVNIDGDSDQAEWGNWYYATSNTAGLSYQSGEDTTVRGNFLSSGKLPNTQDSNFRAPSDNFPVFGFAVDMGSVNKPTSQLFTINLAQDNNNQFLGANQQTYQLQSFWKNYWQADTDAVEWFYNDFATVSPMCDKFDNQIISDSMAVGGQNYSSITQLATRQAFGGIQLSNTTDTPLVFLKEISSDGNTNTADVIFPFHPIALYLNPDLLKLLLDPLYIQQEGGDWPEKYAEHDIGSHFPNGTGYLGDASSQEAQPVEECGNMILMTLAYAQQSGDNDYLKQHYPIMKQWADYLIQDSLIPAGQLSTDDFQGPLANQTNLAIKGIVGIAAMAEIAKLSDNQGDVQNYTDTANDYVQKWQGFAMSQDGGPHTELNYGNTSTYSLLYNAWPDRMCDLNVVPQSVLDDNSAYYPSVAGTYGVPLDTRSPGVKSDWSMWTAAISSSSTKKMFIDTLYSWIMNTPMDTPDSDLYDVSSGDYPTINGGVVEFINRPVVGGLYAPLALTKAPKGSGVGNSTSGGKMRLA